MHTVDFPVAGSDNIPSPKYSIIEFVPPLTVKIPVSFKIISFGDAKPFNLPVSLTPMILGIFNSHSIPLITSAASAPPTPIAAIVNPPAFGV